MMRQFEKLNRRFQWTNWRKKIIYKAASKDMHNWECPTFPHLFKNIYYLKCPSITQYFISQTGLGLRIKREIISWSTSVFLWFHELRPNSSHCTHASYKCKSGCDSSRPSGCSGWNQKDELQPWLTSEEQILLNRRLNHQKRWLEVSC